MCVCVYIYVYIVCVCVYRSVFILNGTIYIGKLWILNFEKLNLELVVTNGSNLSCASRSFELHQWRQN